ncbi:MAG: protein translocase subunit SecF [Candidatus Aenigmarchaeota archaeon]|nr:protein translocase subunit SecF [Candidatus Aenigmarchaeota archaeon]
MFIWNVLNRHWKKLMFIPIIIFILSVGLLVCNSATKGSFIEKDVEMTGGKLISIITPDSVDIRAVEQAVGPDANVRLASGITNTILVQVPEDYDEKEIINKLDFVNIEDYSVREIGPALGKVFWRQTQLAIVFAFVLMALVVFLLFRSFVPSSAVVLAAASDITITVAVMSIIGLKLSLGVLAALLMLIGYSIDTDILLTSRLLKTKGQKEEKIKSAMKTGLTMTSTTLGALIALYFFSEALVLKQIANVLIIGLIVDIFTTWLTNVGILRWWLEKREK